LIGVAVIIVFFIPAMYFDKSLTSKKSELKQVEPAQEFEGMVKEKEDNISVFNNQRVVEAANPSILEAGEKFKKNIKIFFSNRMFLLCSITLANLFFILTVVQYWAADYLKTVLDVPETTAMLSFIIVCITSPTLGVIIGGVISQKLGGYESNKTIFLVWILSFLAAGASIPIPFATGVISFTIILWLVLFFGGAILPPITGIIISSLPAEHRGSANSINFFSSNLLGYLPAPFVYGALNDYFKNLSDPMPKLAFICCMYYSFGGFIILTFAVIFRKKGKKPDELSKEKIEEPTSPFKKLSSKRQLCPDDRVSIISAHRSSEIGPHLAKVFGTHLNVEIEGENNQTIEEAEESRNSNNDDKTVVLVDKTVSSSEDDIYVPPKIENKGESASPIQMNTLTTPFFNPLENSISPKKELLDDEKVNTTLQVEKNESMFAPNNNGNISNEI
jgi:hypothetical protein